VVKSLCERHGIPYRQESVFRRFGRMLDVAVGKTSMRQLEAFPRPANPDPKPPACNRIRHHERMQIPAAAVQE
jgi:hypothetical protein